MLRLLIAGRFWAHWAGRLPVRLAVLILNRRSRVMLLLSLPQAAGSIPVISVFCPKSSSCSCGKAPFMPHAAGSSPCAGKPQFQPKLKIQDSEMCDQSVKAMFCEAQILRKDRSLIGVFPLHLSTLGYI